MSLVLLMPLGLAALAAWLVPLLIHLRRRSEQQRTVFAALRWLPARARPRSRLRFEEWPLLLVRLLLLAALALLLAAPVLFGGPHPKRWVVLAPGVDRTAVTTREDATEYRWLAPGFPVLETTPPVAPQQVGSLLRELDATLPEQTTVTVLVPSTLDGTDAVRPKLHRSVQWRVVAGDTTPPTTRPEAAARPPLAVRYTEERAAAARFLSAAAVAWEAAVPSKRPSDAKPAARDVAAVTHALPPTDRPLAWVASGPLPKQLRDWIGKGGTALLDVTTEVPDMRRNGVPLWRDQDGDVLVRGLALGRGRILQWTRPLTPEAMPIILEPTFPDQLWTLFAPAPTPPTRIAASDYIPLTGARAWPETPRDLQPWFLILVALLFVVERWMASGRREVVSE
ncbi:BatA domain-containing protein [Lysobacter tyrosinilyticus]